MKLTKIILGLLFLPSICFADRLGSLRSGTEVMLSTQGIRNQNFLQTGSTSYADFGYFGSSLTVGGNTWLRGTLNSELNNFVNQPSGGYWMGALNSFLTGMHTTSAGGLQLRTFAGDMYNQDANGAITIASSVTITGSGLAILGTGDGEGIFTIAGATYTVVGSSVGAVGSLTVFSSTWNTITAIPTPTTCSAGSYARGIDVAGNASGCTVSGGGGSGAPVAFTTGTYGVTYPNPAVSTPTLVGVLDARQFNMISVGTTGYIQIASSITFSTITITNQFNLTATTITSVNQYWDLSASTLTARQLSVSSLTSGQCVQTGTGGILTVTGSACSSGGGGASALEVFVGAVRSSPTASISMYSGDFGALTTGSTIQIILNPATTDFIHNQQSQQTATANISSFSVVQKATTGDAATFTSTGTGKVIYVIPQGNNGGAYQDQVGAVTVEKLTGVPTEFMVLHDSTTDAQLGMGLFEIWEDASDHNDPLMWVHNQGAMSNPYLRVDDPAPDEEIVCTSTDNAHGLGKWEPHSVAYQGVDLQINNRAYDNTTFETLAYWHPLHLAAPNDSQMPGLYIRAQNVAEDGGVISSSGTSGIAFFTQNGRTRGLTAPLNPTASWWDALPATTGSAGNIMYHGGNVANGAVTVRQYAWSGSDYTYAPVGGVTMSTLTVTSSATFTNVTISGTCSGAGCGTGGGGGSPIAFTTGTTSSYANPAISSPLLVGVFEQNQFKVLATGTTGFFQINTSSISALGPDIDLSGAEATGILAAARHPALTGDITTPSGSVATTLTNSIANIHNWTGAQTYTSSQTINGVVNISTNVITPGATFYQNGLIQLGSAVSASLPLQTDANKYIVSAAIDLSGSQATGALAAGRFPALTGDVTTSAGSLATTLSNSIPNIHNWSGAATFTSSITATNAVVMGGPGFEVKISSNLITPGATFYQNGLIKTQLTASRCIQTDASGNLSVAAGTCGTSAPPGGAKGNVQYYDGTTFAGASDFNVFTSSVVIGPTYKLYASTTVIDSSFTLTNVSTMTYGANTAIDLNSGKLALGGSVGNNLQAVISKGVAQPIWGPYLSSTTFLDIDTGTFSTSVSSPPALQFSLLANTTYTWDCELLFKTAAAPTGLGLAAAGPASPGRFSYVAAIPVAADGTGADYFGTGKSNGELILGTGVEVSSQTYRAKMEGTIANGANAGTLQIQFASEVVNTTATIRAGSLCNLQRYSP